MGLEINSIEDVKNLITAVREATNDNEIEITIPNVITLKLGKTPKAIAKDNSDNKKEEEEKRKDFFNEIFSGEKEEFRL